MKLDLVLKERTQTEGT